MVITDLKMPGASGLEVLRESRQAYISIPVILLTAFGSVEEAVAAMKDGAFDFIQKPVDLDHLKILVERATRQQELLRENLILREEFSARYGFPRIVGDSPAMKAVSQQLQRVAPTESTVLLLGESGTGKELFARGVHHLSTRRDYPFIALNCAAIPEGLVENELFGHERGAFTGAGNRKAGKIEIAQRGTLFLDEIGELPLASQAKLLRVLDERRFERVGGTQSIEVDVRIIVATNRDRQENPRKTVSRRSLLQDFCRSLNHSAASRTGDDLILLASHFLRVVICQGPIRIDRRIANPPRRLSLARQCW
jgi:DNA-binding NtrC family response regulator